MTSKPGIALEKQVDNFGVSAMSGNQQGIPVGMNASLLNIIAIFDESHDLKSGTGLGYLDNL